MKIQETHLLSKNPTFFIPAANSYTRREGFKFIMKNPAWLEVQPDFHSKNLLDPVPDRCLNPDPVRPYLCLLIAACAVFCS